jgi:hypothetical protein
MDDQELVEVLAAIVFGVPSLFWGTRMTLSGYYERQQAIQSGRQASSTKLGIGTGLMILGIALLGAVAKGVFAP